MNATKLLASAALGCLLALSCKVDGGYSYGTGGKGGSSGGTADSGGSGGTTSSSGGSGANTASGGRTVSGDAGAGGSDDPGTGNAGAGGDTEPPPPDGCELDPCENGGTCQVRGAGFVCTCPAGYSGSTCQIDIDECDPNPCVNGTCTDGVGTFTCTCADGFLGSLCDGESDECAPNPCENGGTCVDGPSRYSCDCPTGYSGTTCELRVSGCADKPCLNGGTCKDGATAPAYTCTCPAGYTGSNCQTDINDCSPNPCNGGTCTDKVAGFSCACPTGYTGATCATDVNECMPTNPCQHGTCTNTPGSYTCDCAGTGYTGKLCDADFDECSTGPCQHGGTCANKPGTFTCTCTGTGYTGTTCQNDVNECMPTNPCQNGGSCSNTAGSYTCSCPARFTGKTCEFQKFRGIGILQFDTDSYANAVSDDGTVVVGSSWNGTVNHAIRVVGAGPLQYLPTPTDSDGCQASAVSADGALITGHCTSFNPPAGVAGYRPYKYTPAAGIAYIPATPLAADTDIDVTGMSSDGKVIVGYTLPELGVRWTAATGWVMLGRLSPNGENRATAANQDGSVIVGIDAPSGSMSWRWTAATGQLQLTRPGTSDDSYNVYDVSPNGNVIVGDNYSNGTPSAIRWLNGTPSNLGPGNGRATSADGSVVVGFTGNNGAEVATVWNSTGAHTLASLLGTTSDLTGWTLRFAVGVSSDGKVVVGSGTHGGVSEGWIAHLP